jgi:glycosyltransferase involved in cell wall biosynthesis
VGVIEKGQVPVSVIIPAFNAAGFIEQCLASVVRQTFTEFEVIVVNDGSTDETPRLLEKLSKQDRRIRWIDSPNRGVSHARNLAMRDARGNVFALIDADDQWEPTFLQELLDEMRRHPETSIVSGNALNEGGAALHGRPVTPWPSPVQNVTFLDLIEHEDSVFIMSVLKRQVYETLGGFNEALHHSEDYEFWLRALGAGFRLIRYPKPLGRYRRSETSATANLKALLEANLDVLSRADQFSRTITPTERAAIGRQQHKIAGHLLLHQAKTAMLGSRYAESSQLFLRLWRQTGAFNHLCAAAGLRIAPSLFTRAYQSRSSGVTASPIPSSHS